MGSVGFHAELAPGCLSSISCPSCRALPMKSTCTMEGLVSNPEIVHLRNCDRT